MQVTQAPYKPIEQYHSTMHVHQLRHTFPLSLRPPRPEVPILSPPAPHPLSLTLPSHSFTRGACAHDGKPEHLLYGFSMWCTREVALLTTSILHPPSCPPPLPAFVDLPP